MSESRAILPGGGMRARRGARGEAVQRVCVEYRTAVIILVVWIFLGSAVVWNASSNRRSHDVHHFETPSDTPHSHAGERAVGTPTPTPVPQRDEVHATEAAERDEERADDSAGGEEHMASDAAAGDEERSASGTSSGEEEHSAGESSERVGDDAGDLPLTTVECVEAVAANGPDNQLPRGTCLFHNVYFHGAIFYLLHADDAPLQYRDVRISTRHWVNSNFRNGEVHVRTLPRSRAGEIGLHSGTRVPHVTRTVLPHSRLFPKNHGHMMIDTAIPLMWSLDLFRSYTADTQVVFIDGYGHAPYDDRIRMITANDPVYIHTGETRGGTLGKSGDYKDFSSTDKLCGRGEPVCMLERVVAGVGDLGFWFHVDSPQLPVRAWEWRLFRDRAIRNLGLSEQLASVAPPARADMDMIVVDRKDKKHIRNVDAVVARLQREFPDAHVRVEYMTGKSLADQVVMMQRASFMFAVEGTAVDNALFMQDNSGMLVLYPPNLGPEGGAGWWNQQYHHDHGIAAWNEYLTVEALRGHYDVDLDAMAAAAQRIVASMRAAAQ